MLSAICVGVALAVVISGSPESGELLELLSPMTTIHKTGLICPTCKKPVGVIVNILIKNTLVMQCQACDNPMDRNVARNKAALSPLYRWAYSLKVLRFTQLM